MEFLVSYKVTKRNDINDIVVENTNALVLDTDSTDKHHIEYDNVVETEGTSFVILDESELNNIEEYTFYEFLTMHYDKI